MIKLLNRIANSLAAKLILTIALMMILCVGILLYKLITSEKANLTNNAIKQTALYSDIIKKSVHYDMLIVHRENIQNTIESIGSIEDIKKITIFDLKKKIIYSSDPGEIGHIVDKNSIADLERHADPAKPSGTWEDGKQWTIYKGQEGYRKLTYIDPIYNEHSCYSASCHFHPEEKKILGILQTDFTLLPLDNDIRRQTLKIIIYALAFMTVTSLVLFLFLKNLVQKPVLRLSKAMRQITEGNISLRVSMNSRDEIGMLGASFNEMSDNLKRTTVSRDLLVKEVKERKEVEEQLVKSELFLTTIFESIQDPFIILDRDYKIVRANKEYARLRNIPILNLLNEKCHKVIYGKDGVCDNCIVNKTFHSSDPCATDKIIQLEDGTKAWFDIYTYPITDDQGQVSHVIEYLQDITHRKRAEKATKNAYIELEQIFNTAADGMCVIDKSFKIVRVNTTLLALFGLSKDKVLGKSCYEIFPDSQCNTPACPLTLISGGTEHLIQFESEKKLTDGKSLYLIVTATAFRSADGEFLGIVENFKDISERKRMEEELRSLSLRDELTGLYNRRGFLALAERELKMADRMKRGIFMLYADLDGLKTINDTLGHTEGDIAIKEAAKVLQETFRTSDIVGRIGGDEFVVLPIGVAGDKIEVITSRLQKNIDVKNDKNDRNYKLSLSVGLAYYDPESPITIEELLIKADSLMYEQKRNKRKSQ